MGLDCASAGSYPAAQCLLATCLTNLSDSPFFPLHRILLVGAEIGSFQHRATQSILLYLSPDLVPRYATAPACRFQSSSSSSTQRPSASARSPSATVTSGSAALAGREGGYQARQQWYQGASYSSYYGSPYYRSWLQRTAMGAEVQRQSWQNLMHFQQSFAAQAKDLQTHQDASSATGGKTQSASGKKTVFNLLPHCKEAAIDVVFSMSVTITT